MGRKCVGRVRIINFELGWQRGIPYMLTPRPNHPQCLSELV
jgi:hypothetical protein